VPMRRKKHNICALLVRIFWVLEKSALSRSFGRKPFPETHQIDRENEAAQVLLLDGIENPVLL